MDYFKKSLEVHKSLQGKIETRVKAELETKDDLSVAYSPWVAEPCRKIAADSDLAYDYTFKSNTIAVITDGSAVLGLGNIWAKASIPVMEGKCALFKRFGWLNAFPIVLDTQDTEEIIKAVKQIAPVFWWVNLEDISAPRCFEIEERLKTELDIPVFHDDQHGTAIVALAGIINSLKIVNKKKQDVKVVINGVWAAWVAITNLLLLYGIKEIVVVDSSGTIYAGRERLNATKQMLSNVTNTACVLDPSSPWCVKWWLAQAVEWRDIFIWVSAPWVLTQDMVRSMNTDPIIFAMANPTPEIMPEEAYEAWAKIVATGRSDYPNQLNNILVFPWIFKWALKHRVSQITDEMKLKAAEKLAWLVDNPTAERIIPWPFDDWIVEAIAKSVT